MKACPQCHIRYPTESVYCFLDGAVLEAIRDPLIGTTIAGRYLVEDVIGEGGMATVYRARHTLVDRPCAVKVMNPALASDPTTRERFRREAKSTQSLAHPNVIEIFDQGETPDGTTYIVMELLAGKTLAELTDKGPIPLPRAIPIMIQISRGIARAHDLGVVHRDLKPENIFIVRRPFDGSDLVKILDFGIAKARGDTRLTNAGELFGTPQYLAPERITGGEAGPSVDLYALGVIFFEMATGKLPFEASDPTTFLIKHMKEKPPPPRAIDPRLPEKLDTLVVQLLEKDPKARPVDAHRIEQELVVLSTSLGIPVPPEPEDDPQSSRPPAATLPPAGVHQWVKRVEVFEQMLARADGNSPRRELERTLGEVRKLVRELAGLRESSALEQRKLEDIDARGRDGRTRFGFAVDALGLDASKARGEVRAARTSLESLAADSKRAGEAYKETQRELIIWEGRSGQVEPYAQLARACRACAEAVDGWLAVRTLERAAQAVVEEKERTVTDLDYQIAELRAGLTNHEHGIDRDRDATQKRLVELNAGAERAEAQLVQLATSFCQPLRARPELAPLFQQLESNASAAS
ncbi:MAG: serine/threonine-protein kinase [Polyangiaceae bacterium]|jgi:serine/threonine-protein kinase